MGAFEYLSVLMSSILALGMTRVLAGVGEMLQDFRFLCKRDSRSQVDALLVTTIPHPPRLP